ncbi:hypothetical protein DID80_05300 [Candidatus Marinamargulisbacteria bacterium SCGC AAA071-K20]|nr:hypothetical protein DID80_05300 [Candidatus Marinamargulisbacteria bacterium SCGC AAA071-K20]
MRLIILILLLISTASFSQSTESILDVLGGIKNSLNHISAFESTVYIHKVSPRKVTSFNYLYKQDDNGNKVAQVNDDIKQVHVKNKFGYFFVFRNEVLKQERDFPFEGPTDFLEQMDLETATSNFNFQVHSETNDHFVLNLQPFIRGGQSIDEFFQNTITTLRLTLSKNPPLLKKVELFRNNSIRASSWVIFDYSFIDNHKSKAQTFKHKLIKEKLPVPTYIKSVTIVEKNDDVQTHIKETRFTDVNLRPTFGDDEFDEEAY